MHILVTGGAGYVGSVSVEALLEAGHDVTVLDDLSTGHRHAVARAVELEIGSYANTGVILHMAERRPIDAVLHCAAKSVVPESMVNPAKYYRENVAGGVALLEGLRQVGVRRVVFSSTAAVYGVPERVPIPEDAPVAPVNTYGETKRTFEGALRWYGNAYGLRSVILRYFNVAGASKRNGEHHDPETHLIPNVLAAAERGSGLTLNGDDYPTPDGTCIRDYIHVADLAQAHLLALTCEELSGGDESGGPVEPVICNLGNGRGFSNREVVAAAERVAGTSIAVTVGPRRTGDPPVLLASAERAKEVLGWRPVHDSLDEMIESAWRWRQAHPKGYTE